MPGPNTNNIFLARSFKEELNNLGLLNDLYFYSGHLNRHHALCLICSIYCYVRVSLPAPLKIHGFILALIRGYYRCTLCLSLGNEHYHRYSSKFGQLGNNVVRVSLSPLSTFYYRKDN